MPVVLTETAVTFTDDMFLQWLQKNNVCRCVFFLLSLPLQKYTVHSSVHQINYSMSDTVLIKNSGQDIGGGGSEGGGVGFEVVT